MEYDSPMKLRGTLGGLNLLIEPGDTADSMRQSLQQRAELLKDQISVEIQGDADPQALMVALQAIAAAGGHAGRVRAPRVTVPSAGPAPLPEEREPPKMARTTVVPQTLRSGFRGEYSGSVVILGDVNPGTEIVAGGDVIVMGALRGLVHAGYGGNEEAIVWGRPIVAQQIRIAGAMARAPEGSGLSQLQTAHNADAEIARLEGGQITIDVQKMAQR